MLLILAIVVAILLVAGQTSLKYGLIRAGGLSGHSVVAIGTWTRLFVEPFVLLGFMLYGAASLVWLRVLSDQELSLAYPLISFSYAASLVVGSIVFHDHLSVTRVVGVAIIILGAVVVSRS